MTCGHIGREHAKRRAVGLLVVPYVPACRACGCRRCRPGLADVWDLHVLYDAAVRSARGRNMVR